MSVGQFVEQPKIEKGLYLKKVEDNNSVILTNRKEMEKL